MKPDELVDNPSNMSKFPPDIEEVEVHGDMDDILHNQHGEHGKLSNKGGDCQLVVSVAQKENFVICCFF